MAAISACQVGSFSATTRFAPSPMMRPSCTMTQPKAPPAPSTSEVSADKAIARAMKVLSSSVMLSLSRSASQLPS
jgi:hypothetical protein